MDGTGRFLPMPGYVGAIAPGGDAESSMKAIVQHRYGPPEVLRVEERPKPECGPGEVLVRVRAAGVNIGDWHLMRGIPFVVRLMFGFRAPKEPIPGSDVAGTVESVGEGVTSLRPGDAVFGWCKGAFAEQACAPAEQFRKTPVGISFEQAAATGGSAITALQALRDQGRVQAGQRVLVIGASGGVGTFAVQIAKAFGAHVTGVCSTTKLEMVRSIGADEVIDYTREDFAAGDARYDLVLDVYGSPSLKRCRHVLAAEGTYVLIGGSIDGWMTRNLKVFLTNPFVSQTLRTFVSQPSAADLEVLRDLLEQRKITPVIDRTWPLEQAAAALAHVGEAHARGKTVLQVAPGP